MTRYDIDIHHMSMRSLGGGNDPLNLIPLPIPIHVKVHVAYAMLFDNHEVLLAASFMIYRGSGGVVRDELKQLAIRETFQDLFEDDSAIEAIAEIRCRLSRQMRKAHERRRLGQELSASDQIIIDNYETMKTASKKYQVKIRDMANQIKTGSLTVIESKKDYKLLQRLIAAISIWENQRWIGLVKYNNKVSMLFCYHE